MSETNTPQSSTPSNQGGSKRLPILLGILAIGLVGLGYDRFIARPAVEAAYDSLLAENQRMNADSTVTFTDADVRKLLGRDPAETFTDTNGDTVERYSWRAGMPIKSHDLFVVYKTQTDFLMFHRADKFAFESGGEVSQFDTGTPLVVTGGQDEEDSEVDGESGGGEQAGGGGPPSGPQFSGFSVTLDEDGPGAGGPGAGGPGGGALGPNSVPTDIMAEYDKDSDGLLKGEELVGPLEGILGKADLNQDDAISMDELYRFAMSVGTGPENASTEKEATATSDEPEPKEAPAEAEAPAETEAADGSGG
jgi:hypothetical protein